MRWKNITHRCPRCGALQSHLMLWCSCITIVFPKTATLHVAAIGGSLNAPITRPAPAAGFFVAWPLHVVVCVWGVSVNADRRCTRPPRQKLRHQRSGFQFQPLVAQAASCQPGAPPSKTNKKPSLAFFKQSPPPLPVAYIHFAAL